MSYKRISEIQRAERTYWSPERGGRTHQMVGNVRVPKYSYSPYTAKPYERYTFYADVEMEKEIESPPGSGTMRKFVTILATVDTFIEFKKDVLSGDIYDRIVEIVESMGGVNITGISYWRNRGE